jgi:hypothetical protein
MRSTPCEGSCRSHPKLKPTYQDGQKSCRPCFLFLKTDEWFCPCCKKKLSCRGRSNKTQLERRKQKRLRGPKDRIEVQLT